MLAIARALVANPKPLVLDDATEGPAPLSRAEIRRVLATLREAWHAMLVIDRCVRRLIRLADRQVLIEKGCVVRSGSSASPDADRGVQHCHIGP